MNATLDKIRELTASIDNPKELKFFHGVVHKIIMQKLSILELNLQQQFSVGDSVILESRKGNLKGEVISLKQKNIRVKTEDGTNWTVSPSYLRKIDNPVMKEKVKQKPFVNCFGVRIT